MYEKREVTARVEKQESLTEDVRELILETELADDAMPGQFVNLFCGDGARLLPRPISVCDTFMGRMKLVYRVVGAGTAELAALRPGDTVRMVGNLGNGYDPRTAFGKNVLVVGGGLGIPPMYYLSRLLHALGMRGGAEAPASLTMVLGYRDQASTFLHRAFTGFGKVVFASDDGTIGYRGTVLDAIRAEEISCDVIYACGPLPMLRGLASFAEEQRETEKDIKCYVSLEERMACGIGTCLGCVVKTKHEDAHSRVRNARICTEGPVFDSAEIAW
ncbi:MAG: dihydroorotate dehydrogenase electron transfer subunit [Lachnospiraceae bacterium]|nr:dihydroorotate dehydrogenase electron transfer subunit [Lachnospiraceae bacterium]